MGPSWPRVAAVGGVLLLAFFVARSCQQSQIRITQEQAVATAERQVNFEPEQTQIRLLRQGVTREPFWIVSLSIPSDKRQNVFSRLAVVRLDANSGKVEEVIRQQAEPQRSKP